MINFIRLNNESSSPFFMNIYYKMSNINFNWHTIHIKLFLNFHLGSEFSIKLVKKIIPQNFLVVSRQQTYMTCVHLLMH